MHGSDCKCCKAVSFSLLTPKNCAELVILHYYRTVGSLPPRLQAPLKVVGERDTLLHLRLLHILHRWLTYMLGGVEMRARGGVYQHPTGTHHLGTWSVRTNPQHYLPPLLLNPHNSCERRSLSHSRPPSQSGPYRHQSILQCPQPLMMKSDKLLCITSQNVRGSGGNPDQSLYARSQSTYSPRQQSINQHHRSVGVPMVVHSASTSPDSREAWLDFRQIQHHQLPSHGIHAQQYRTFPTIPQHHLHQHQFSSTDRLNVPSLSSSVSVSTPSSADSDDVRMSLPPFNELVSGASKVLPSSYHQPVERSPLVVDHDHRYRMEAQPAPFANAGPPGVGIQYTYGYEYSYGGQPQRTWVQQFYPACGTPYSYGQSTWLRSRGM